MKIETLKVEVKYGVNKPTDFKPVNNSDKILGVMVAPKYVENTDVKLSIQNSNGASIIDPISLSHFADRPVEWGKNYIPLNLQYQNLRVMTEYTGEDEEYSEEIELVFIFGDASNDSFTVGCN